MYQHLEMVKAAGADQRLWEMFDRYQWDIIVRHVELEETFWAMSLRKYRQSHDFWIAQMTRRGNTAGQRRYDDNGVAEYYYHQRSVVLAYSNQWLERFIQPLEVATQLALRQNDDVKTWYPPTETRPNCLLKVVDSSDIWPPFYQERKDRLAWIAVRPMKYLSLPREQCADCGRGGGDDPVKSSKVVFGAVWGLGRKCVGDGYLILQARDVKTGELCRV